MFWWKRNWNCFSYYIKPEFPGIKFYKYVGENFKSPNSAKGQIKVAFVVQIDGTLKDFKIKGLNYDMNVEALRVLFNSPCGSGKVDGKAARVKFSIPLTIN
jgi:hypothetical protein